MRAVAQRVLHRGHRTLPQGERDYVMCLFTRHPDFLEKDMFDIKSVFVAPAPGFEDHDCFWFERGDGSKIDISYNKCAMDKDHLFTKFVKASRRAIQDNLEAFIEQEYKEGMLCPYSQQPLTPNEVMVEHHPVPLELLLLRMVKELNIDLTSVKYDSEKIFVDAGTVAGLRNVLQFTDEDLADQIAEWHADNADMQLISRAVYVYQPEVWAEQPHLHGNLQRMRQRAKANDRWKSNVLKAKAEDGEDDDVSREWQDKLE